MIQKCECGDYKSLAAEFQNKRYGYGMRVHTPSKGTSGADTATCTVCGKEKPRTMKEWRKLLIPT